LSALAIDLMREVSDAGGTVRLEGDVLRLSAPEPLPEELRARLRQHKAEIVALLSPAEPASHMSPEGPAVCNVAGLPREISEGVHAILSADRAKGIPQPLAAGAR
jgi:TubC N-terminal docking domain